MEEATENGKELSHFAHPSGMTKWMSCVSEIKQWCRILRNGLSFLIYFDTDCTYTTHPPECYRWDIEQTQGCNGGMILIGGKPKSSLTKLSHCKFVYCTPHIEWSGTESGPRLRHGTGCVRIWTLLDGSSCWLHEWRAAACFAVVVRSSGAFVKSVGPEVGDLRVAGKGTEGAGLPGHQVFLSVQNAAGWVSLPHKRYVAVRRNLCCIVKLPCVPARTARSFRTSQ